MVRQEQCAQSGYSNRTTISSSSRVDDNSGPSSSAPSLSVPTEVAVHPSSYSVIDEEVIERILAEASMTDQPQNTPPSAGGGGRGGAGRSKNIFSSLNETRSVHGNSRLAVNVSRSYYSAKAEMCALLGRDWLDAVVLAMTSAAIDTTAATTSVGPGPTAAAAVATESQGLDKPSPISLQHNDNSSSPVPTLVQIREVLELGMRYAEAAIGTLF